MGKVNRKSLLTEEQKALLERFQKGSDDNEVTPLNEKSTPKTTSEIGRAHV